MKSSPFIGEDEFRHRGDPSLRLIVKPLRAVILCVARHMPQTGLPGRFVSASLCNKSVSCDYSMLIVHACWQKLGILNGSVSPQLPAVDEAATRA